MGFLQHAFEFLVTFVKKLYKYTPKYSHICPKRPFYEKQINVVESPFIWLLNCPICLTLTLTGTKLWKKGWRTPVAFRDQVKNIYFVVPLSFHCFFKIQWALARTFLFQSGDFWTRYSFSTICCHSFFQFSAPVAKIPPLLAIGFPQILP